MIVPGFGLFDDCRPANPFIARQRRQLVPFFQQVGLCQKDGFNILWNVMNDTRRNLRPGHELFHWISRRETRLKRKAF